MNNHHSVWMFLISIIFCLHLVLPGMALSGIKKDFKPSPSANSDYIQTVPVGIVSDVHHNLLIKSQKRPASVSADPFRYTPSGNNNQSGTETRRDTVPEPKTVLRKSLILPGWGQVVNKQAWKVPVIYGLFAGLSYFVYDSHQNYQDYRAAYYNTQYENGDKRFGPTPDYLKNISPEALRYTRNEYRNRRDLTALGILLAYGLNLVDAYVFAHMRDFDVSDDLSANIRLDTKAGTAHLSNNLTMPGDPAGIRLTLSISIK